MQNQNLLSQFIFGQEDWNEYIGQIANINSMPQKLAETLEAPCPFWEGKKIKETHLVTFIPDKVNGSSFNLNLLGSLVTQSKKGHKTGYKYCSSPVKESIGEESSPSSYWILMTKDIIPNTQNKNYKDQQEFVAQIRQKTQLKYELPTTLQAASSILLYYTKTGEYLFTNNDPSREWVFTRSKDEVSADKWAVAIGGFSNEGLFIYRSPDFLFDKRFVGVAGAIRFD